MEQYGNPKSWLVTQDEHSDAELEDALDVVGDAEPVGQLPQIQYEDISDAEDAPAQAHVQYENIPEADRAPDAQFEDISEPEDIPDDTPLRSRSTGSFSNSTTTGLGIHSRKASTQRTW